jgi:dCTP deaminase
MILPDYLIRMARGNDQPYIFEPFFERSVSASGMSFGLSYAGYDVRIKQPLTLRPDDFALASTLERISMPPTLLGIVHDKSSWARKGLAVQNTVIECGWSGWLTLELKNEGDNILHIEAGDPIAQIVMHELKAAPERTYSGKYSNQPDRPVAAMREGETFA